MSVSNHAWTERPTIQKLEPKQSHWDQAKPRLDQYQVLIKTRKKQEEGLQVPTELNGSGKELC